MIKTAKKNEAKLKYEQKLNAIKQHYKIEFDVNYLINEKIKSIRFNKLEYKTGYDNLSVTYDAASMKISFIEYDYTNLKSIKNYDSKSLISNLEKDLKLKLIVNEITKANNEYLKEINEINIKYQNVKKDLGLFNKVLQINKNDEN